MEKNSQKSTVHENIKVLSFFLNQALYAILVSDICEVNRMPVSTVKTLKPKIVMGLLNFHGSAACILNLKRILEFEPFDLTSTPGWIAVKGHELTVCLAVDAFFRFMEIHGQNLSTIPVLKGQQDSKKIKYYARVDNDLIPVLDTGYIVSLFQEHDPSEDNQSSGDMVLSESV